MGSCLIRLWQARKLALMMCWLLFSGDWVAAANSLPRFVSSRVGEVNVRAGPGMDYPIVRRYMRAGIPLEIVAAVKEWRRVRDWDGKEGWVHRLMLNQTRTARVASTRAIVRHRDDARSAIMIYVEQGVFVSVRECRAEWCLIGISDQYEGWIVRSSLWGVYPDEEINQE